VYLTSFLTFGGFRETRNLFRFLLALDRRLEWLERAASHATRSLLRCRRASKIYLSNTKFEKKRESEKLEIKKSVLHMH